MFSKDISISEAITLFIQYKVVRRGSTPTTEVTYKSILRDFTLNVRASCIGDLTLDVIDEYINLISQRNFKPKTFKNKVVVIRSFIRYLYAKNLTDVRPESIELPKIQDMEANFLDYDEQERMLDSATSLRDKAMILTMMRSGLRVSELINLQVDDLFERSIIVRCGKGKKSRVTFIDPETEEAIKAYHLSREYSRYIFTNYLNQKISRQYVARMVSNCGKLVNPNKKISPHTLRHTFATNMLRKGARIEDVQPMMGHANISTTRLYMHFTNDYLHQRYDDIMAINGSKLLT